MAMALALPFASLALLASLFLTSCTGAGKSSFLEEALHSGQSRFTGVTPFLALNALFRLFALA